MKGFINETFLFSYKMEESGRTNGGWKYNPLLNEAGLLLEVPEIVVGWESARTKGGGENNQNNQNQGHRNCKKMPQELAFSFLFHNLFCVFVFIWQAMSCGFMGDFQERSIDQQQQQTNRVTPRHGGRRQYRRRCISKKRAKLLAAFPKSWG